MPRRSPRFTAATIAILAAVVPALAGCTGSTPAPAPAPAPSPSPSPPSMTVAAYEQILTRIDKVLDSDFQRLRSARTPSAVSAAATAAEGDASRDLTLLFNASPPARFKPGNTAVDLALNGFDITLNNTASAASASQVCTGTSAMAAISRSQGTAQLRSAEARLSAADPAHLTHLGSFLPPFTADADNRPANETLIKKASPSGLGELEIDNSESSADAVVSLATSNTAAAMAVYVRAMSSYTVHGIGDGTYHLYVTNGNDWETPEKLFARNCDFLEFGATFDFTTKTSGNTTVYYTVNKVILTPSVNGNTTERNVPPAQFPQQ